jgi:hypothetical protein
MPGSPFLYTGDSYQGVMGEGNPVSAGSPSAANFGWSFWLWLVLIGVVIPVVVLGGLRAGGLQFVYRRR